MAKNEIKISTLIGENAVCNGDFSCPGSARVDGTVNGNVVVEGTLILGTAGCINGDIYAKAVVIGGEVNGNIEAPEKASFSNTSKVYGDVTTGVIVVDEKAFLQGSITMSAPANDRKGFAFKKGLRASKRDARIAADEALAEVEDIVISEEI